MGVYSGWGSSLLNVMLQFFLMNYLLYDFILRDSGEVLLKDKVSSVWLL